MKSLQLIFVFLFSLYPLFTAQIFSQSKKNNEIKELNFNTYIQLTLKHSPELKIKSNETIIKKKERKIEASKLLSSSLDFSSYQAFEKNFGVWEDTRSSSSPWGHEAKASLSWPIYTHGANRIHLNISKIQEKISLIELEKKRNQLLLNATTEFYEFSRLSLDLKISEKKYQLIKDQYKKILREYKSGLKLRKNFLRFKAQLRRSELEMARQKNNYFISIERLRKIIGVKRSENFSFIPLQVKSTLKDFPTISSKDIKIHYDYRISELNQSIQSLMVRVKYRSYLPELLLDTSLSYDYNHNSFNSSQEFPLTWKALLRLSYKLWDGGQRRRAYEIEKVKLDTTQRYLDQTLLTLREEIGNLTFNSSTLREEIKIARELLDIEKQSFKNIQEDYRLGKSSYLDFITALRDFLNADLGYQAVYFQYLKLFEKIKFYKGTIYGEFIKNK